MHYRTESNKLVIVVTPDEQEQLREAIEQDDFDSDSTLHHVFESLVCNFDLQWIDPSVTGDLTCAPMLAMLGDEQPGPDRDAIGSWLVHVGCWTDDAGNLRQWYQPVLRRWALMDYQITSPQRRLAEQGAAEFVS